jgi:hypothetical protein
VTFLKVLSDTLLPPEPSSGGTPGRVRADRRSSRTTDHVDGGLGHSCGHRPAHRSIMSAAAVRYSAISRACAEVSGWCPASSTSTAKASRLPSSRCRPVARRPGAFHEVSGREDGPRQLVDVAAGFVSRYRLQLQVGSGVGVWVSCGACCGHYENSSADTVRSPGLHRRSGAYVVQARSNSSVYARQTWCAILGLNL